MNQKTVILIIVTLALTTIAGVAHYFFMEGGLAEALRFAAVILAAQIISEIFARRRQAKLAKNEPVLVTDDEADQLVHIVGGKANIKSVSRDASRLKIELADVSLLKEAQLQAFSEGAVLSGQALQLNLGNKAAGYKGRIEQRIK